MPLLFSLLEIPPQCIVAWSSNNCTGWQIDWAIWDCNLMIKGRQQQCWVSSLSGQFQEKNKIAISYTSQFNKPIIAQLHSQTWSFLMLAFIRLSSMMHDLRRFCCLLFLRSLFLQPELSGEEIHLYSACVHNTVNTVRVIRQHFHASDLATGGTETQHAGIYPYVAHSPSAAP